MAQVFGTQERVAYLGNSISTAPNFTWFGGPAGFDATLRAEMTSPVTPTVTAPSSAFVCTPANAAVAVVNAATGGNHCRISTSQNFGYSGFTIAQIDAVRAACVAYVPTVVMIEAGTNNTSGAQSEVEDLLDHLVAEIPGVKLWWLGVGARGSEVWDPDPNAGVIDEVNDSIVAGIAAAAPASCDYVDINGPRMTYEAANNLPSPGAASGILTLDGTHYNQTGQAWCSGIVLGVVA